MHGGAIRRAISSLCASGVQRTAAANRSHPQGSRPFLVRAALPSVLRGAAMSEPKRSRGVTRLLDRLVYLAAVIPQPGKSLLGQFREAPEMFRPDWLGKDPTKDASLAFHFLFHDCTSDVAQWALSTLRLMNARAGLAEECPLRQWPNVASSYISCTEDRTIDPAWWENTARERLRIAPIQIRAGHAPHVSQPAQLASILDSLAFNRPTLSE